MKILFPLLLASLIAACTPSEGMMEQMKDCPMMDGEGSMMNCPMMQGMQDMQESMRTQ